MDRIATTLLYGTVCMTGAAVLIIEIAAVRLLGVYFGTSLYALSSVLAVILGALALGYLLGGKIADRCPSPVVLFGLIGVAGGAITLTLSATTVLLQTYADNISLILGPPLFASVFFIPAFLLGIDSPFVVRLLQQRNLATIGSITGRVFFFSTFGSILGSIATGFILIPTLGVTTTILLTAASLLIISTIGGIWFGRQDARRSTKLRQIWALYAVALLMTIIARLLLPSTDKDVIAQIDSRYAQLTVQDQHSTQGPIRQLFINNNHSAAQFIEQPYSEIHPYAYSQFATNPDWFMDETPTSFLVLGGGAYTIPNRLIHSFPSSTVDVVEIDPHLYNLAQTYFALKPTTRLKNHVMDARTYIHRTDQQYDIIFADTMNTGLVLPAHLTTVEYFERIKNKLNPNGIFFMNTVGILPDKDIKRSSLLGSIAKTLQTSFPYVTVFRINPKKPHQINNYIFVASVQEFTNHICMECRVHDQAYRYHPLSTYHVPLNHLITTKDVVITDERSVIVERLTLQEYARW